MKNTINGNRSKNKKIVKNQINVQYFDIYKNLNILDKLKDFFIVLFYS